MELISVILNVYNGEKYIRKCLDSIVNQTYPNLEIVIVNDGSKDDTLKIIKSYKDDRIKVITTENKGLSLSRNIGIENSTGEFLYFIDVDDYMELDTIEYLHNLIKFNGAEVASCKTLDIYNYDFDVYNHREDIRVLPNTEFLKKILLSKDRSGAIWNKLYKREVFDNIRFENRIINDVVVLYKIALNTKRYVFSNQIKYYYLKNVDSITVKGKPERAIDAYKASIERYDYIKEKYPSLKENDICLLHSIVQVYNHNNKEVDDYLKSVKAKKTFNKVYKFRQLRRSRLARKEKIKIMLYRVCPKIERLLQMVFRRKRYN